MKLEIRGVNFSYDSRSVLEDVTMSVDEGNVVSLVGPNSSGKTTRLKCINKILKSKKRSCFSRRKRRKRNEPKRTCEALRLCSPDFRKILPIHGVRHSAARRKTVHKLECKP